MKSGFWKTDWFFGLVVALAVLLVSRSDLLQSLERTRCILTLSKHVLGTSMPMPRRDPFMSEHLAILDAVGQGDVEGSQALLRRHLEDSCLKVIDRVALLRTTYARPALPYITER